MTEDELLNFEWLRPWRGLGGDEQPLLERELKRELAATHPLYGLKCIAVGRRDDQDDFLFLVNTTPPKLAYVHLTWREESTPEWPWTKFYESADAWVAGHMKADHEMLPDAPK